ncbi:MAG: hypothetical protein U0935_17190 [Pirellulales bacterium]
MNWQVLNPLRLATASKNGAAALWRCRPQLTRRRVAWGTALTMLCSGSGYYGYQKLSRPAPGPQVALAAPDTADSSTGAGGIQPIPDQGDPAAAEGNAGGPPPADAGFSGGDSGYSGGDSAPPASVHLGPRPNQFTSAPVDHPPEPAMVESSEAGAPVAEGPVADQGGAAGPPPAEASVAENPPPAEGPEEPVQIAVETQASPSEAGGQIAPAADSGPPPPATFPPARAGDGGASGTTDVPATPETQPADLIPVPSRPQPPPPEEHVRLPAEAAPDLSPRGVAPGLRGGVGLPAAGGFPSASSGTLPPSPPPYSPPSPAPLQDGGIGRDAGAMSRLSGGLPAVEGTAGGEGLSGTGLPVAASPAPGPKHLEGPQVPSLELEKIAPTEVQVGRAAKFEIKVRNVGRVAAQYVTVVDQIPHGTRLLDANPPCARGADGSLRWQLGALGPGQETSIVLQLLPEQEGEIGSVAQVIFHSQAAMRTVVTRPQIAIEHQVVDRALIGDAVRLQLAITNRGSGATANLVLEATLPETLGHPAGAELEYPIGALRPNETKRIELTLRAQRPGSAPCLFAAREDGQTLAEDRASLDVLAPQLQVGVNGPKVRYLDRQATYSVGVANPGTAPATNLELVAYLPRGLKFISADNQGQYDAQRHAVLWGLAELPAGVMGASQLVVVPIEPGEQRIRVEGRADLKLENAFEQPVLVETLSEVQFAVVDTADPIEVGSETTYEIRLQNRGSRAATQVRVAVEFPAELVPVGGEGPSSVGVRGQQLVIEPLPQLAPNSQVAYQIRAKGLRKGDPRIRVLVASQESPTPVTKEESTRVYADE